MTAWDYIVAGGGSTGCVIANRLAEDGRSRVLVLEGGGSDRSIAISMPAAGLVLALSNPRYDWGFKAEPDPTRGGREDYMPRGKVLGGTSAINGMSYVRGQPEGAARSSQAFAASSMVMKTAPSPWSASISRSSIIMRWPRPITKGWQV